jgi:hypothetical protein
MSDGKESAEESKQIDESRPLCDLVLAADARFIGIRILVCKGVARFIDHAVKNWIAVTRLTIQHLSLYFQIRQLNMQQLFPRAIEEAVTRPDNQQVVE